MAVGSGETEVEISVVAADGEARRSYSVGLTASLPSVAVSAMAESVTEGGTASFEMTMDVPAENELAVGIEVTDDGDVLAKAPAERVRFAPGETRAALSLATEDDATVTGDGKVTVTFVDGEGYAIGEPASASVVVAENDEARFEVRAVPSTLEEGGSATVTVAVVNGVTFATDRTVALEVSGSAATSDYALSATSLELPAGAASVDATLSAVDDGLAEADETVTLTARLEGASVGSATVTIAANGAAAADDARLATLVLTGVDIGAFDPETTAYSAAVAHDMALTTVTATPADAGASVVIDPPDADGIASGHQVPLAVGANRITVTVTAEDDVTARTYTVTVTRAAVPVVTLAADAASVTEGTAAPFTASLSEALVGPLTVPVTVTSAGDVLSGSPPASVTFAAGETVAILEVPTHDDLVVEGDGTVTAALTAGEGYALGEASSASVTIADDDVAEWSVTAEPAGIEEGGSATLSVSIGNGVTYAQAHEIALSVDGEVTASDYTLSAARLPLAVGAATATATLLALEDEESEGPERATVTARLDGAEIGSAVVTVDDALPLEAPTVTGVPQVGETLTVSEGGGQSSTVAKASASGSGTSVKATSVKSLSVKSASVAYQWLRDGTEIAGATGPSRVLTELDVGSTVSVRASRGGSTATSAATIPIWAAPWNPPVGADEEELFSALLTVGSTGAYPLLMGGYGRLSKAAFGALDDTVLRVDGVAHRVTFAALNDVGQFGLGTEPDLGDMRGWSVYWDGHRIDGLSLGQTSDGALWVGEAPTVYERYLRGLSDGVRVALSIRRALPTPVATLAAVGDSVDEGSGAVFEVTLDRAPAAALEIAVEVAITGDVVSGETPSAVLVPAGSTMATLEVSTDDDSVVEEDGSVTATLVEGAGYALGEAVAATVAVADNDVAAWTVTAAPAELVEGGSATLTVSTGTGVTFATGRTLALSVTGEVSESDYTLEPGTLDLEAGTDTATATFEALSDGVEETPEAARLGVALEAGTEVASTKVTVRDASTDASLSSLLLTDVDIGEFDAERTAYAATVPAGVSTTTVTAEPSDANAAVVIADALGSTQGTQRTSALAAGSNEIAATVTAEDASTARTYTVAVTRLPGWGTRLPARDIALDGEEATGVWSDGTTLWAVGYNGEAALAYDLATGARRPAHDVALTAERYETTALWSEDGTLWVANALGEAVAYRLSDGARLASADLDGMLSAAGNGAPWGLWSDGSVLYVVDRAEAHLYAYASDDARLPDREFGLNRDDRSRTQWGLWSDGETLLTSGNNRHVVAYRLSDGARLLERDIELPRTGHGLWSDGETLWVADSLSPRLLAYAVPGLRRASGSGLLPVVVTNRAVGVPSSDPGAPVAIPDAGLRTRIAAALGKAPEDPIGVNELLSLQSLDAGGAEIADLTGLGYASNLRALDLSHNPLVDLRVLGSLPDLAVLNLDATGADPWALAGMTGLQRLSLRGNGITDIAVLSGLDRLEALDVGDNALAEVVPLSGLTNLRVLSLRGNAVQDVGPLAALPRLLELDVTGNRIGDFGSLAGNGRLTLKGRDAQAAETSE